VSLTKDKWISRTTEGLLTVMTHFIYLWQLKSLVLAAIKFSMEHTAEHIAGELRRVTDEWGISNKVAAIVTDNASNMVAAVRITGWTHIHCFTHTLYLVIQEVIKIDSSMLSIKKKCKDIVTFFHHSVNGAQKIREIQRQIGLKENKMIQEVGIPYFMVERMVKEYQAVTTTLCLLNQSTMYITTIELQQLKIAVTILQPFEAATRETSAERCFSVSALIPLTKSLMHFVAHCDHHDITLVKGLQTQLLRRFGAMESNHNLAARSLVKENCFQRPSSSSGSLCRRCHHCLFKDNIKWSLQ